MAKAPFTPSGVQQKFNEIYALPQSGIDTHAQKIASDFRDWMDSEFSLNVKESQYLDTMDDGFLDFLAAELSLAVKSKIPVYLDEPYPPLVDDGSKRVNLKKYIERTYTGNIATTATGSYHIAIDYVIV